MFAILFIIFLLTLFIIFFLFSTSSGLFLPLVGIAAAPSSAATTLLARTACTILAFLLVPLLVFSFLFLNQLFDLMALLEVVTLGTVNLAVQPVRFAGLLTCCSYLAIYTCSCFLVGAFRLGFLGGVGLVESLYGLTFPFALSCAFDLSSSGWWHRRHQHRLQRRHLPREAFSLL